MYVYKVFNYLADSGGVLEIDISESVNVAANGDNGTFCVTQLFNDLICCSLNIIAFAVVNDTVELFQVDIIYKIEFTVAEFSVIFAYFTERIEVNDIHSAFFCRIIEASAQAFSVSAC